MSERWVSTPAATGLRGRRNNDTEPELLLRSALHAAGARFRLHPTLASGCNPDLVLSSRRIAVWVDGDFWHGCPVHGRTTFNGPNAPLWAAKMQRNRERDARASELARQAGWTVVRLWECEIRASPADAARRVLAAASAADVGVDEHVAVEPVDRVIQGRGVQADIDTGDALEPGQVGEGEPGSDGEVVTDAFFRSP